MWNWLLRWLEGPPEKPPGWQEEWLHYSGPGRTPHTKEWHERKYRYKERYGWLWILMLAVFMMVHGQRAEQDVWFGIVVGLGIGFVLRRWRQRKVEQRILWPWGIVGCTIVVGCWHGHPHWAKEATYVALFTGVLAFVMQRVIRWFWRRRKWVAVAVGMATAGAGGYAVWETSGGHGSSSAFDPSSAYYQQSSLQAYREPQSLPAGWGETRQLAPGDAGYYSWAASTNRFGECASSLVPEPQSKFIRSLKSKGYKAEDSEDLAMEALVKTCEHYSANYVQSLPAYYGGTLRNVVANYHRKGMRRTQCGLYPPSCTPYDYLADGEKRALLEWAACQLSRRQEWVFRLKMNGASSREIAAIRTQTGDYLSLDQVNNAWDAAQKRLSQLIHDRYGC